MDSNNLITEIANYELGNRRESFKDIREMAEAKRMLKRLNEAKTQMKNLQLPFTSKQRSLNNIKIPKQMRKSTTIDSFQSKVRSQNENIRRKEKNNKGLMKDRIKEVLEKSRVDYIIRKNSQKSIVLPNIQNQGSYLKNESIAAKKITEKFFSDINLVYSKDTNSNNSELLMRTQTESKYQLKLILQKTKLCKEELLEPLKIIKKNMNNQGNRQLSSN